MRRCFDYRTSPSTPEVILYVKYDDERFDAVERWKWYESYLSRGITSSSSGIEVLTPLPNSANRANSTVTAIYETYSMVVSIVFPALVTIDPQSGQCLYDRACLSLARLIKTLCGVDGVGGDTLDGKIRANSKLTLTVLIHQADHAIVDCLCQDVLINKDTAELAISQLLCSLKAAETRAFSSSRILRKITPTGEHNNYNIGSLLDIITVASERVGVGIPIFSVITDFGREHLYDSAVAVAIRDKLVLKDAQLVFVNVGNDSKIHALQSLAAATSAILIDWGFIERLGPTPGTLGQVELIASGYIGNTLVKPVADFYNFHDEGFLRTLIVLVLAADVACLAAHHPTIDVTTQALSVKLRRAVLSRTISRKPGILVPGTWYSGVDVVDGANEKQCKSLLMRWTITISDPSALRDLRIREGWTVSAQTRSQNNPTAIQASLPRTIDKDGPISIVTLLYEASVADSHETRGHGISSHIPQGGMLEVRVWIIGPNLQQYGVLPFTDAVPSGNPSKEVLRLHEFVKDLQKRDTLFCNIMDPMGKERTSAEIVHHSSKEGCSGIWRTVSTTHSLTVLISDSPSNGGDAVFGFTGPDSYDSNRAHEVHTLVQSIMQKWPAHGSASLTSIDSNTLIHHSYSSFRPHVRRLSNGVVVVAQFFLREGTRLPACMEIRTSIFAANAQQRVSLLSELRKVVRSSGYSQQNYSSMLHQRHCLTVSVVRDELSSILSDIIQTKTSLVNLEQVSDLQCPNPSPHLQVRNVKPSVHRHILSLVPLSFQYDHRCWSWLVPAVRLYGSQVLNLGINVYNAFVQSRLKDSFVAICAREGSSSSKGDRTVLYRELFINKGPMILYSVHLKSTSIDVEIWMEQGDRKQPAPAEILFTERKREVLFEEIYLQHSLIAHAFATYANMLEVLQSAAHPQSGPLIVQHAKAHMRVISEHDHRLFEIPATAAWTCFRCRKRQSQTTVRWVCLECQKNEDTAQDVEVCLPCVFESEVTRASSDVDRFAPVPTAPSTVPIWYPVQHPEGQKDGSPLTPEPTEPPSVKAESLHLPQVDLLLRGGCFKILQFPCVSDELPQLPKSADIEDDMMQCEPFVQILEALQEGGHSHESIVTLAKAVVVHQNDGASMKRVRSVLQTEAIRSKSQDSTPLDLSQKSSASNLRTLLLSAATPTADDKREKPPLKLDATSKTSSALGLDAEDWAGSSAAKQVYSRVLNCVRLLCNLQIDISASDFPGGRYPSDLIPPGCSLATCPSLHCAVRQSSELTTLSGGGGSLSNSCGMVVTILPTLESAKPVTVTVDGDEHPTKVYQGLVHEVNYDSLTWDVIDPNIPCEECPEKPQTPGFRELTRSPQGGAGSFKMFLEYAQRMMFAFGVYRMLQCSEHVSTADIKRAQSACVDYVSDVDITDLVAVFADTTNPIPHEKVNEVLKCVLDKNFGPMTGTECHYFYRGGGQAPQPANTKVGSSSTDRKVSAGGKPSAPSSRVTMWPRVSASICSSAAAPSTVATHRAGQVVAAPHVGEGLTASVVAKIPSVAGIRPVAGGADQLCEYPSFSDKERKHDRYNQTQPDDLTSFPTQLSRSSSTVDDPMDSQQNGTAREVDGDCDSPREVHSFSEPSEGVQSEDEQSPSRHPSQSPDAVDDLPLFLLMTITYQVSEPRKRYRTTEVQRSYTLPVNHTILNPSAPPPEPPRIQGTLVKATLSLVASSIPRQYFELSRNGFYPTRRDAVRKCMVEIPGMDTSFLSNYRSFSQTRDAYVKAADIQMGPQPEGRVGDPYQFFPHRQKKLMERTMRRVQAVVHETQLQQQLRYPLSIQVENPMKLIERVEYLRPKNWSRITLRFLVLGDLLKKPHLALYFKDCLGENSNIRIVYGSQGDNDDVVGSTMILAVTVTPGEEAAVTAAIAILSHSANLDLDIGIDVKHQPRQLHLSNWLIMKIISAKPVYSSRVLIPDCLGMDRSLLKLRLWLYGPDCLQPSHRVPILAKVEDALRNTVLLMNKSLLLEDCYTLSCISDLLVPPEKKKATRYVGIKAAVAIAVIAEHYASERRIAVAAAGQGDKATPTTPQIKTPSVSGRMVTSSKRPARTGPGSLVRPPSGNDSVRSLSQYSGSRAMSRRSTQTSPPEHGWHIKNRDSLPKEPWDQWGGLACTAYVVSELDLGIHTDAYTANSCFLEAWRNWQCANRRIYLWKSLKDESTLYFQYKQVELIDYTPYKITAIAAAVVAETVTEKYRGMVEEMALALVVSAVCRSIQLTWLTIESIEGDGTQQTELKVTINLSLIESHLDSDPTDSHEDNEEGLPQPTTDSKDQSDQIDDQTLQTNEVTEPTDKISNTDLPDDGTKDDDTQIENDETGIGQRFHSSELKEDIKEESVHPEQDAEGSDVNNKTDPQNEQNEPTNENEDDDGGEDPEKKIVSKIAHDSERGRLRASMILYSVRQPYEVDVNALVSGFTSCMRCATVCSLSRHLSKSGGKISKHDLLEMKHNSDRRVAYTSIIPIRLTKRTDKLLEYSQTLMKKFATEVHIDGSEDEAQPQFIFPKLLQGSQETSMYLALLEVSLTEASAYHNMEKVNQSKQLNVHQEEWGPQDHTKEVLLEYNEDSHEEEPSVEQKAIRFVTYISGDYKELQSAVTKLKDALQNSIIQVFCEATIEELLPDPTTMTTTDFENIIDLCERAQTQHLVRRHEKQKSECCTQRRFPGTIPPSAALSLTHDILQLAMDLNARITDEPGRFLQPLAFLTEGSEQLTALPDFSSSTFTFYHNRIPVPPVDFYIICGRRGSCDLPDSWTTAFLEQFPEPQRRNEPPVTSSVSGRADLLRFYENPESLTRSWFFAWKITGKGLSFISYNTKVEYVKSMQHGVMSILSELQKRLWLQSCVVHQKMGIYFPEPAFVYPSSSMLVVDMPDVMRTRYDEVSLASIDDTLNNPAYNRETTIETALAAGRGKMNPMGVGGSTIGRGTPGGRMTNTQPTPTMTRRQSSGSWLGKGGSPLHSMLMGVGGVSSRAAVTAALSLTSTHASSGKLSLAVGRHFATFKSLVLAEQHAAQQLRAKDAVKRDIMDFQESIKIQWPYAESASCLLYCLPPQQLVRSAVVLSAPVGVLICVVSSLGMTSQVLRTQVIKEKCRVVAYSAGLALAAIGLVALNIPKITIDSRYQKIIHSSHPMSGIYCSTWPAYYVPKVKLKSFVANCIRMRQSSRLYHCQRVPFLYNSVRKQLLLGPSCDVSEPVAPQVAAQYEQALKPWKNILFRLMREYVEYLTRESRKSKQLDNVTWITACINTQELLEGARPTADDDVIRTLQTNTAVLMVTPGVHVQCRTSSFVAVAELNGGVLLIDLSVREACFALEFYLFDAAACNPSSPMSHAQVVPPSGEEGSNNYGFHQLLALIRSQLHMNSVFYDNQIQYMHRSLRNGPTPQDPYIDWAGVVEDSVQLYERPPLYSVNFVGCRRVMIPVPELLDDIPSTEWVRALNRFFTYVCKLQKSSVNIGDKNVLLMYHDVPATAKSIQYECDAIAILQVDSVPEEKKELPINVYLVCATPNNLLARDNVVQVQFDSLVDAAYAHFGEEIKRQCDDANRNYRIHRLWKRLIQQRITPHEIDILLGRVEPSDPNALCAVAKRNMIPLMDPSTLTCFQNIEVESWARLCANCASRYSGHFVSYETKSTSPDSTKHWVFAPKPKRSRHISSPEEEFSASIIVEYRPRKGTITTWWCSPRVISDVAETTPSPVLQGRDKKFFCNWVHAISETMWATEC
eukprot:TRINITY_DN4464_c0_g1_i2.p1 TRINITY_DN4464_c0_g1~~TRINITY_DN4464_c0_g1_i2.p1  ORF type:complete len:3735 (+),score=702.24 TRINITY_DN4464_c0_g1_i2:45-11249(+)